MRKLKTAGTALAVMAAVLGAPETAGTAFANSYTFSAIERCINHLNYCVYMSAHSTYSNSQVWINGKVNCHGTHTTGITWCGVGGGNGTVDLYIGVDWYWTNLLGTTLLWERMDLIPNHVCNSNGYNSDVYVGIGHLWASWYNAVYTCEHFLHHD
jgi:hypothetical protein